MGDGFAVVYEVAKDDGVLRTESFTESWTHVPMTVLIDELEDAGLVFEQSSPRVGVVRVRS